MKLLRGELLALGYDGKTQCVGEASASEGRMQKEESRGH